MSNPNPPVAGMFAPAARAMTVPRSAENAIRGTPRWRAGIGIALFALYAAFIATTTTGVAGGSDSSGYLNSARLLAAGRLHGELRLPPELAGRADVTPRHFSPLGFNLFPDHPQPAPTYPTGLPLHFAAAARLLGWNAGPYLVQLLSAVAAVALLYASARELDVSPLLAGAGAATLAVFPVFIFTSIQTLSDTLATTWTLAAVYAGLRARASDGWRMAAGFAFGMAVLVRPTNLLLAPGLIVLIALSPRRLGFFILGGVPCAAWLAFYNDRLYGSALTSGYGNISDMFSREFGAPTALHFGKWLAWLLPPVVLALPFAALLRRETRGRTWFALALMSAGVIGVYLFYHVSHEVWWCLRFILPAVATTLLLAVLGLEALARSVSLRWIRLARPVFALVLAGWAAANSWYWTRELYVLHVPDYERTYLKVAQFAGARLPPNALVLTLHFTGSLYFYTKLPTILYDAPTREELARYLTIAREAGRPIYAIIFDVEEDAFLRDWCPGNWQRTATVDHVGIWRLS